MKTQFRIAAISTALVVLFAACGDGDSKQGTSGRARNESTTTCFASQAEKDAVLADTTADSVAVQTAMDTPICELTVAPVSDPSVSECVITVVGNGATVDVSACDSVTKLSVGPLAEGQWQEVVGNSVIAAAIGESRTVSYKAWAGEIVVAEGTWNLDATDNVGTFARC